MEIGSVASIAIRELIDFFSVKQKVGTIFYKLNLMGFVLSYNPKLLTIIYNEIEYFGFFTFSAVLNIDFERDAFTDTWDKTHID